jgi:DNA mismatch repair protein MutL
VNVHPTKQEVRFQDSGRLYSQLLGTLRARFLTTDLTARGSSHVGVGSHVEEVAGVASSASELVAWAKQELGKQVGNADVATNETVGFGQPAPRFTESEPLQLYRIDAATPRRFDFGLPDEHRDVAMYREDARSATREQLESKNALQVHNRYLVVENDAGIEVIDQHALHERILYEQIREKVLGGALESQKLLVPEPVDLTAAEASAVLEHAELLAQLGLEVQPFGGETVIVSSYPAMLANLRPAEVLHDLVERLMAGGRQPEARDLLDDLLHTIACKAAVKFGDRLTPDEVEALLAQRHLVQDQHHCPHGRPTALVFTREDLDRQFKRI